MLFYFLSMSILMLLAILSIGYGVFCIIYSKRKGTLVETLVLSFVFGLLVLCLDYVIILGFFGPLTQWNVLTSLIALLILIFSLNLFKIRKRLLQGWGLKKSETHNPVNVLFLALICIFAVSLISRLYYVSSCYPYFTGWDTPFYVSNVVLHTHEFPNYVPGGEPYSHSLFYPLAAIFFSIFQNSHAVPIFATIIDSFSIFGIYLLFKYVSKSAKIALLGVFLYCLSFFAFRFFSDLFKDVMVNALLPIGLYFVLRGYDNKDIHSAILAGLIFGFSMLVHTDSLYRISLCLIIFSAIALAFSLRSKNNLRAKSKWLLRFLVITFISTIAILSLYQIYLSISGVDYSLLDRFYQGYLGPLQPVSSESQATDIASAIPPWLLLNDWAPLLFGSIFLILRNKRDGIFWSATSLTLLSLSLLPFVGVYLPASVRIFYYYGFFSYLLKATFLFSLSSLLIKTLTKSKPIKLSINIRKTTIKITAILTAILIIAVLLFDCCVAQTDNFSFYPFKKEISHLNVFTQSSIGQGIINQNQIEGLLWLKDQVTDNDRVISSGVLYHYTSYILWGPSEHKEIMLNYSQFSDKNEWIASQNLISGDLVEGIKYFSDINVNYVYLALDGSYTQKLAKNLSPSFKRVFQNPDISIFRVDVQGLLSDFNFISSNAYVNVTLDEDTFTKQLKYSAFDVFPYFSLSLAGFSECTINEIPSYLVLESIHPTPEGISIADDGSIYFEEAWKENCTLTFIATFPFLNVGWKDESFKEWTQTEGATLERDGDLASVFVNKTYGGIYIETDLNASDYQNLIIRYKVEYGVMEIYFIYPNWSSKSVLVSGTQDWNTEMVELQTIDANRDLIAITIQGDQVPTAFDLDFILFAPGFP